MANRGAEWSERAKASMEGAEATALAFTEDQHLAVAAWVFVKLNSHDDGTFRTFIHDDLGFSERSGAYWVLTVAGALDVLNGLPDRRDST